ncbi:hypothetical protein BELL_0777g00050 [Botrytis elliptica]|uniref:Peptidase A1 domain-containing protein n=1 Tax=Botrytis elliptica TaxID=278938 RepID=A0A4Z1JK52_9HELO|nr:hypothetical protein EAE99_003109 [Botrytis elliptica]TGO69377.1 hypothetical protein BELL_0777g00050 [Botrytis elliptica]
MRTTFASALLVSAITFPYLSCAQKFVQVPIARVSNGDPFVSAVNVAVGNPPQNMTAILDTGSSDFWVPATGSKLCADPKNQCIASDKKFSTGSFASNSSTTFVAGKPNFFAIYSGGVNVTGTFMQDSIRLGNTELKNNTMGLSTQGFLPTALFPVMGIGFAAQEFSATDQNPTPYENLPLAMKSAGLTNTAAYGIYINDFRSAEGSIIFGGMDTAKFTGNMTMLPILENDNGQATDFVISATSLAITGGSNNKRATTNIALPNKQTPVLLDTGNPSIDIPLPAVEAIGNALNANPGPDGSMQVTCDIANKGMNMVFGFSGTTIQVPIEMMLTPAKNRDGTQAKDNNGNNLCVVPVNPTANEDDLLSFGAPFFSAAYAVMDLQNKKIGLAQAKVNATESNVQEITAQNGNSPVTVRADFKSRSWDSRRRMFRVPSV